MDKTTEQFVGYATDLRYSDLTSQAIHAVKRSVLDSVGCALGAFRAEPIKAVRALASRVSATAPATVIGTQIKTAPEWAAFASGAMVRYLDFNDDYFGGSGDAGPHPSDNIGGLLAAAESAGVDGKALVLGIALAYETCGQLVDHVSIYTDGWDYPILHSISTALGAGNIMGLSRKQMGNALGLAIVPNICLSETRLGDVSNWKGFAGPNGSRNGLFAAFLAKEGITGPPTPFEGKAGFMKQLNCSFELGAFGGGQTAFKVEGTFFKHLPVRYDVQLPVGIALEVRDRVKLADIESICVYLEKRSVVTRAYHPNLWNPISRETADHSGPYLIGAVLVDGGITEKTFTPERYRDPAILGLIQKIRMEEDPQYTATFPRTINSRFEVTLKSGAVITVHKENPKGHPANPMSDQELEAKFLKQVDSVLAKKQSRALLDALWKLEELDDFNKLFSLMQVPAA
ncbi:MAG: MmgE/PrpD family protein [Betaproteobacteria bacterium]|nr:MmgE/PrpD family protein [Betaproteobacteria bacterium]